MASRGVTFTRREFLVAAGLAALAGAGCDGSRQTGARPQPPGRVRVTPTDRGASPRPGEGGVALGGRAGDPRWPGHRPARVYLGLSYPDEIADAEAEVGPVGVQRSYFLWDDLAREAEVIGDDHANRRLPWVSFKAPGEASGWEQVASGDLDDDLRLRARHYARFSEPVVVTFHHEPSNDRPGDGEEFVAAWTRVHDVMRAEADLSHVALVPVIGEWEYNPTNVEADPEDWISADVLDRASFLGVDVYQNASGETYDERLGRVLDWLAARGYPDLTLGVGETGCTDTFEFPTAVQWWSDCWSWVEANTAKIGVVAYFDSARNSREHVYWPLDESSEKERAFELALQSPTACRLPA